MTLAELCGVLEIYATTLNQCGAESRATALTLLSGAAANLDVKNVKKLAEHVTALDRSRVVTGDPSVGELVDTLEELEALARALSAKASFLSNLADLRNAFAGLERVSIESCMENVSSLVASASPRRRKGGAVVNENLVSNYLERLEKALPDPEAFASLFVALNEDNNIGQGEAIAIASRFMAPTPSRTSRRKALDKVMERHTKLMKARESARAQAGKSAA
jgi:hypothetical protein